MRSRSQEKHKFWFPRLKDFSEQCFFILASGFWLLAPNAANSVAATDEVILGTGTYKVFLADREIEGFGDGASSQYKFSPPPHLPRYILLAQRSGVSGDQDVALYPLPVEQSVGLGYGWRVDPVTGQNVLHAGVDLLAPPGTSVLAADNGVVAFAGQRGNYGNIVVVNHQGGRQTRYAHLASLSVRVGQRVQRGDTLGTVGATGQPDIEESHLHFELRYNSPKGWVAQDPLPWLGIGVQGAVVR